MAPTISNQVLAYLNGRVSYWLVLATWVGAGIFCLPRDGHDPSSSWRHHGHLYDFALLGVTLGAAVALLALKAMYRLAPRELAHPRFLTELHCLLPTAALFASVPVLVCGLSGGVHLLREPGDVAPWSIAIVCLWSLCARIQTTPRVSVLLFLSGFALTRILPEPRGWAALDHPLAPWILPMFGVALARWISTPARTNTR